MAYISFQPKDHFNTKLYTGTGSSNTVTGVGFQPDLTWIKNRGDAESHCLFDAVRTNGYYLKSDANSAEIDGASAGLWSAFASDGFTVVNGNRTNDSGDTYVSWNWKANGAGSSNTDGSITSTVSANTTSGFSIVKYTGAGANATVGHGLGVAPKMIIVKNTQSTYEWVIGHADLASGGTGFSANWYFNGFNTGARNQNATASWNSTSPTNSVFSLHSGATYMNASGEANIAYCFAEKKGFSKFGLYTGNGSTDGTFVYTGFKPAFVMYKRTDSTSNWGMHDNGRDVDNPVQKGLIANASDVEDTHDFLDFLSNGFKLRSSSINRNASGGTYIYMAFSDQSIVSSNGVPAVAR
jgi:hypothetical protein